MNYKCNKSSDTDPHAFAVELRRATASSRTVANNALQRLRRAALQTWRMIATCLNHRRQSRRSRLRVLDVTSLGEKRVIAVVQVGREKFLVGGAANSISLLAQLQPPQKRNSSPKLTAAVIAEHEEKFA